MCVYMSVHKDLNRSFHGCRVPSCAAWCEQCVPAVLITTSDVGNCTDPGTLSISGVGWHGGTRRVQAPMHQMHMKIRYSGILFT
jgi:hypothetical protein